MKTYYWLENPNHWFQRNKWVEHGKQKGTTGSFKEFDNKDKAISELLLLPSGAKLTCFKEKRNPDIKGYPTTYPTIKWVVEKH